MSTCLNYLLSFGTSFQLLYVRVNLAIDAGGHGTDFIQAVIKIQLV